jgi:hypothetical protein
MSLEIAVGLSQRYQKDLVVHNLNNFPSTRPDGKTVAIHSANYYFNDRKGLIDKDMFPTISDLMVWEGKKSAVLIEETLQYPIGSPMVIENMLYTYSSDTYEYLDNEEMFSEGREKLPVTIDSNIYLKKTLGHYSRFFFNRSHELDNALASVRFNEEYYDLAYEIAMSLGEFNGAHLRLTDHKSVFNPTSQDLDSGISSLDGNLPVVLCTDQSTSPVILNSDYKYIFLDEYILNNFYNEFSSLKYREEVSFGALNNLVMHYSKDFIGSLGSTYSGYIQRSLNQKKDIRWKTFCEKEHISNGPYSWNGYNRDTATKQWWREWKESRLSL